MSFFPGHPYSPRNATSHLILTYRMKILYASVDVGMENSHNTHSDPLESDTTCCCGAALEKFHMAAIQAY